MVSPTPNNPNQSPGSHESLKLTPKDEMYAAISAQNPIDFLHLPSDATETRLIQLRKIGDQESINQLEQIPRGDLVNVLKTGKYFEGVITALQLLKTPQNDQEREAMQGLIAVNSTPSVAGYLWAVGKSLLGDSSLMKDVVYGHRGPKIWVAEGEQPRAGVLRLYGDRFETWSLLTLRSTSYPDTAYAKAVLGQTAKCLKGVPEVQLDLVKLAINVYSEKKGIGYDSQLICMALESAYPEQLEIENYSRVVGRVRLPTKWKRYASQRVHESQLLAPAGSEVPTPPSGLDSRETRIFGDMMRTLRKEKAPVREDQNIASN